MTILWGYCIIIVIDIVQSDEYIDHHWHGFKS